MPHSGGAKIDIDAVLLPDGENYPITDDNRHLALQENERMAKAGERVMVVARRDFDPATFDPKGKLRDIVNDLTLLAMVGIVYPRGRRLKTQLPNFTAPASRCE